MIKIELKMFGTFRKYENNQMISQVHSLNAISIQEIKKQISLKLESIQKNDSILVFDSAFANAHSHKPIILTDETIISESCSLAILPPVCGG